MQIIAKIIVCCFVNCKPCYTLPGHSGFLHHLPYCLVRFVHNQRELFIAHPAYLQYVLFSLRHR